MHRNIVCVIHDDDTLDILLKHNDRVYYVDIDIIKERKCEKFLLKITLFCIILRMVWNNMEGFYTGNNLLYLYKTVKEDKERQIVKCLPFCE